MKDTEQAAKMIAAVLREGDVFALEGEMGVGKTTLVKEIVKNVNPKAEVTSPTFALAQRYEGNLTVWHLDLYRLEHEEELEDIGYEDYFYPEGAVTFIEWPHNAGDYLPSDAHIIRMEKERDYRIMTLETDLAQRMEESE